MSKHALTYGLLAGLIVVALNLIIYLINPMLLASWGLIFLMVPIMFVLLLVLGFNIRKAEGGYLTFGKGFVSVFVAGLIISVFSTIYSIVLFQVIDPTLSERLVEEMFDKMLGFIERFDVPTDEIEGEFDKAIEKAADQFSVSSQLMGIFSSAFWWAIGSLIVAAIVKKNPPVDEVIETV
jgi:hypothetical protein